MGMDFRSSLSTPVEIYSTATLEFIDILESHSTDET